MEEFKKFLERKASKTNIRVLGRILSWDEEVYTPKATTEFLDMYYLGEEPGSMVVMDSSTARDLEERLKFLEERVRKLKNTNDILKAIIVGLCIVIITLLFKLMGG